ncbi:MAG: LysM peptidoglycan-binding domain-containing protein [Bacteroidales bacterium]|jgi:membrane-bound lytic murein transglycosylase D|nr:LysM peptidoglycan-binding domain-containing protein [Bacteroidales bacterium]
MKKAKQKLLLLSSLFVLLSMTSCKVIEKYSSVIFKKNYEKSTEETITPLDTVTAGDNNLNFYYENTDAAIDTFAYEDEFYNENDYIIKEENLIDNTLDDEVIDSIEMALQERIDKENSGEAIVEESDEMMGMIENIANIPYFEQNKLESSSKSENIYNYPENYIPSFPDSVYAERIAKLREQTTIELVYNSHVKSFIDVYAVRKRDHTCRILGLADIYFPMFEQALDKYNIPLEIKYLAVVESALNPRAGSHAGAKGLWQFMYATGKTYKLNVTSLVDDRMDPVKATEAACQHLLDLYNKYDDWFLALAAYNSGGGNVNKAIRRAGGLKNYWAVWPFLPKETRGYVPAFIAVNYVMNYSQEHNLYPTDPGIIADGVDSVTVHEPLHFDQLHEMLNIPMEDIKFFNPQYKASIIPANAKTPMSLRLPEIYIDSFIVHEKELYNFKTKKGIDRAKLEEEMKKVSDRSVHIVKSGESLGSIANKYRISVNQLKTWNKLKNTTIYPGQKLIVYSSGAPMAQVGNSQPVERSTEQKIHTVKSGENLSIIAKKYKCTITELKTWNNLKSTNLSVGQKLKVYPPAKQTQTQTQTQTTTSGGYVIYTVKSGDNLWDIAKKFDGVSAEQIRTLNNLDKNAMLKVGQKLKIKASSSSSSSSNEGKIIHTIKSGDNLWDISKKYGVSVEQIKKLNGLNDKSVLKIGQKLIIKN